MGERINIIDCEDHSDMYIFKYTVIYVCVCVWFSLI